MQHVRLSSLADWVKFRHPLMRALTNRTTCATKDRRGLEGLLKELVGHHGGKEVATGREYPASLHVFPGGERERVEYGFNRNSQITWRRDLLAPVAHPFDQQYSYDGLQQLTARNRGKRNPARTAVNGTPAWSEGDQNKVHESKVGDAPHPFFQRLK